MNEQRPRSTYDPYLVSKILGGITAFELVGLGLANLTTDVPKAYNTDVLTISMCFASGAVVSAIAAFGFDKR